MIARIVENIQEAFRKAPLSFFGLAFNKAWIFLALPYLSIRSEQQGFTSFDLLFALAAIAIAIVSLRVAPAALKRFITPLSTLCTLIASALLLAAYSSGDANAILVTAALPFAAVGIMSMAALWADFYALFNPLRAAFFNGAAIILAICISYALKANVPPRAFIILIALSLITALCYKISIAKSISEQTRNDQQCCRVVFPYKAVLFIAVYSLAYGMAAPLQSSVAGFFELRILPALVVVGFAFLNVKKFSMKVLYNIAFLFMICGLVVVALIPGVPDTASLFLLDTSYNSMGLMLMLIACSIAYSLGASAAWLFGMLVAVQFFSKAIGQVLSEFITANVTLPLVDEVLSTCAIILIVLASIAMLSEKSIFSFWGAHETADVSKKGAGDPLRLRVRSLGEAYRLTDREMEVLHLLGLGKPNSAIARDLFIADGTVKAHIQHIYQKLDVHTRKELLGLLGVESAAGSKKEK